MANWCSSDITFISKKENDIKTLFNLLNKAYEEDDYSTKDICNDLKIDYCKHYDLGIINYIDNEISNSHNFFFEIQRESKWTPNVELFEDIMRKFEGMWFVYRAEETGCGIYINTDVTGEFYGDLFKLDLYCKEVSLKVRNFLNIDEAVHQDGIVQYFTNETMLLRIIKELFHREFDSFKDVKDFFHSLNKIADTYMNIFEFRDTE